MLVYGRPVRTILCRRSPADVPIPSCSSTDYLPGLNCNVAIRLDVHMRDMLYYTLLLTLTRVSRAELRSAALHHIGPSQ